jgi:hypothetical protein
MSSGYDIVLQEHKRAIFGNQTMRPSDTIQPFAMVAYGDPAQLLAWLENACESLQITQRDRAMSMLENVFFYNGIQHFQDLGHDLASLRDKRGNYLADGDVFVMNHARDFVNQKVAMLTKFAPAVAVMPWNSTYRDRLAAKFSKRAIDTVFHLNDAAQVARDVAFHATTCGEGYARIRWDKGMGNLTEQHAQKIELAKQMGQPNMLTAEMPGINGEPVMLDVTERCGDVRLESIYPWMILKENAQTWKDVNYIFQLNVKHIGQMQLENPGIDFQASNGKVDGKFASSFNCFIDSDDFVVEIEFFHRRTQFLDGGFYAKFCCGHLLEASPLPSSSGQLPFARLTDYDDLITPHGRSFLADIRPPLILHNKIMNLMYRNLAIAGHPKLMVQQGTVNINSLGSGPFVVEYDGPIAPQMLTFNAITGEMFKLSSDFMGQIQQVAGVFGLSRGDTVPNARAAEILSIYQEQEEQRNGPLTDKYIAWVKKIAQYSLDCASDNYKSEDERALRVFGRNNRYKLRQLTDVSNLKGPSDIVIERTTSLDDTRQGKINKIVQLSQVPIVGQEGPGVFKREQIVRMLELGDSETFFDLYTAAVDAAQSENEDMYEGLPVSEPENFQSQVIHWNEHYLFMQSKEFSDTQSVPEQVRQAFITHLLITEGLMYEQAKKSLTYAQELMTLQAWPCILMIGPSSQLPETQLSIAQIVMAHQTPPLPPMPEQPQQPTQPTE